MTSPLSRRRFLGAGAATAAGLALTACNLDRASSPDRADDVDKGFGGSPVDPVLARPDVTLTTTKDGTPFNLRTGSAGKLSFLYFGYTHCPDQCPVYLSSLARAIESLDGPGSRPQVLFVGVDLARDTPAEMERYLRAINPSFIGLTGSEQDIAAANDGLKFPSIEIGPKAADGTYLVGHYSRALATTPDGKGQRFYDFDTRARTFVADLPRLAVDEAA